MRGYTTTYSVKAQKHIEDQMKQTFPSSRYQPALLGGFARCASDSPSDTIAAVMVTAREFHQTPNAFVFAEHRCLQTIAHNAYLHVAAHSIEDIRKSNYVVKECRRGRSATGNELKFSKMLSKLAKHAAPLIELLKEFMEAFGADKPSKRNKRQARACVSVRMHLIHTCISGVRVCACVCVCGAVYHSLCAIAHHCAFVRACVQALKSDRSSSQFCSRRHTTCWRCTSCLTC